MKIVIVLIITLLSAMPKTDLYAQEQEKDVRFSVGADLVSGYIWRGVWEAGPSIQPTLTMIAGNFSVTAWGSVDFATRARYTVVEYSAVRRHR